MMVKFSLYPYSSILYTPPIDCLGSNPICWLRYICILYCVYIYRAEADGSAEGN